MTSNILGMVHSPIAVIKNWHHTKEGKQFIVTLLSEEDFELYRRIFFANPPRMLSELRTVEGEVCCIWNSLWHELMGIYE